ncbi:hypothetical protein NT01EI_3759 [Edwardsiella ictaluri 93-146]|uniref:Uncharacterized protein n=1 Tax=Edwardsiella ictaluri (strain 93-146) TaxID=634503 RepID=C5BB44_EDWI9|nr:hypothetical protein [Edwardsiella ictaluri]ACR70886.1 hypothetical protein NT01EI_3759 [Edwardsiella ictaluri 93-146]
MPLLFTGVKATQPVAQIFYFSVQCVAPESAAALSVDIGILSDKGRLLTGVSTVRPSADSVAERQWYQG